MIPDRMTSKDQSGSDVLVKKPEQPPLYPAWIAGIVACAIYFLTGAPGISWDLGSSDSGEFAAVAATLGIAHPSGYPLYTLIGWVVIHIFHGYDPAWSMVLFSVVCGAVSVGLLARTVSLAVLLIPIGGKLTGKFAGWLGALVALFAAINPQMWSQATICEVYSFGILFQCLVWLILVSFLHGITKETAGENLDGICIKLGLVMGFLFAHHIGGGAVLIPVLIMLAMTYGIAAFRGIWKGALAMVPGLLFYLYLPIRSSMNPGINWGRPDNFERFVEHVSAKMYRPLMFAADLDDIAERFQSFITQNYIGTISILLVLAGLIVLLRNLRDSRTRALISGLVPFVLWIWVFATFYAVFDYEVFYYPLLPPATILGGAGLAWIAATAGRNKKNLSTAVIVLILVFLVTGAAGRWGAMDRARPDLNSAPVFVFVTLSKLPENSLIIVGFDQNHSGLLYGKFVGITVPWTGESLEAREDIDVLAAQSIGEGWFRENIKNRPSGANRVTMHDADVTETSMMLIQIIERNLKTRPVYVDEQAMRMLEDGSEGYTLTKVGGLFEVEAKQVQDQAQ